MKHVSASFLLLLASALTASTYPTDNQEQKWTNPMFNDHVTVTFYTAQNCPEDKKVVLACQDQFTMTAGVDPKSKKPTCVSGQFASYQLTTSHNNMLSIGKIGISEGQDQCNFKSEHEVISFEGNSILGSISGGCHNLAQAKGQENFLNVHSGKTYSYQCTKEDNNINQVTLDESGPPRLAKPVPDVGKRDTKDLSDDYPARHPTLGWFVEDNVSEQAKRGWKEEETKPPPGQSNDWYLEGIVVKTKPVKAVNKETKTPLEGAGLEGLPTN